LKLADTISIHCNDAASSTAPIGQHPESDGTTKRDRNYKGGPDKGGVAAGGPGSGCNPEKGKCGRQSMGNDARTLLEKHGWTAEGYHFQYGTDFKHRAFPGHHLTVKSYSWQHNEHGTKVKSGRNIESLSDHLKSLHGEVQGARTKMKTSLTGTSGGQSEGSSRTALKYYVVDGHGRVLHTYRTKEEAETASAGNRYTKVVTHVEQATPMEETPEVMNIIRRRPGDNQVRVFRRSVPFPNTPYPGGPTGR